MAFDKPFEEVFQDMAHIDAKIQKESDREDLVNQREMLQLQGHLAQYNNPLNFLTPILIVTIIIIAILATGTGKQKTFPLIFLTKNLTINENYPWKSRPMLIAYGV